MEIVKIDPKEYGLEEKKAEEISKMFKPMLDQMVELEKEFNKIAKQKQITPEVCIDARTLRMKYVKVRTGTAEIHKELKAFYLQGGRFVDGWKNAQLMASQGIEEKLMSIEKYYENLEKEKREKLQNDRASELQKLNVEFIPDNLAEMDSAVWNSYLLGVKESIRIQQEAEKKAEEERIEELRKKELLSERLKVLLPFSKFIDSSLLTIETNQEEFEELIETAKRGAIKEEKEQERIRKENEKLRKDAEEKAKRDDAERKAREEKERKEREAYEAKLAKEREEKERIERELQEKKDAEAEAERLRKQKIEDDLKKGDKEKYSDMLNEIAILLNKYEFKSSIYKERYDKLISYIELMPDYIN